MKRTPKLRLSDPCVVLSLILCLFFTNATGQYTLQVLPVDRDSVFVHSLKLQSNFKSKDQLSKYIDQLPTMMQAKGYAAMSIDSIYIDSLFARVSVFFGERYNLDSLAIKEDDKKILESLM